MSGRLSICNYTDATTSPGQAVIELREPGRLADSESLTHTAVNSPRIGFHWGNRYWAQIAYYDNAFRFYNSTLNGYVPIYASTGYLNATSAAQATHSASAAYASNTDTVDSIHARGFLRNYYNNSDLTTTETVSTDHYLFSVGDTGGWVTTSTKPSGLDNAFGILHVHLHQGNYAMQLGFGGTTSQVYFRNAYNSSSFSAWKTLLDSSNYTSYTVTKTGSGASGAWGIDITGTARGVRTYGNDVIMWTGGSSTNDSGDLVWQYGNGNEKSRIWTDNEYTSGIGPNYRVYNTSGTCLRSSRLWAMGEAITSAVWNDYAEYRESDDQTPGYVLIEVGDDTLTKSTKRLQPFAGISSDTWGFAQGETDKAKTPIAVSGRVLVYPYQDRNKYKPGQCVCTAPGGKVDIMRRWEEILFPSRIVGVVSCVPEYEEWGSGEFGDRPRVKVDGRIWIKVCN